MFLDSLCLFHISVSWVCYNPTKQQLYDHQPAIMKTIKIRRTRHAGHCWRSRDELISDTLLWTPSHGRAKAGRPAQLTYSSSVLIWDVALRTCRKQWTIGRCGERGSEISMLIAHDHVEVLIIWKRQRCE